MATNWGSKLKAGFLMVLMGVNFLAYQSPARAQAAGENSKSESPLEAREAVGTILVSGLLGGILGLSTLSFYKKPQDHVRNITLGAAAGVLISIVYITVEAASSPMPADNATSTGMVLPDVDPQAKKVGLAYLYRF